MLNYIMRALTFLFIGLFLVVSFLKIKNAGKRDIISHPELFRQTVAAGITAGLMLYLTGITFDIIVWSGVGLALLLGVIIGVSAKLHRELEHIQVEGRIIGSILWIFSVLIGEYLFAEFSDLSALPASFVFGFVLIFTMNTILALRLKKIT